VGGAESADRLIPSRRRSTSGRRRRAAPAPASGLEEISTVLAARFDIVAGITVLALVATQVEHVLGALR